MSLRSFHHSDFPADRLRAERSESISVCVPAREEAATIAGVVEPLLSLRARGVIESPIHGADGNLEFLALYEKVET